MTYLSLWFHVMFSPHLAIYMSLPKPKRQSYEDRIQAAASQEELLRPSTTYCSMFRWQDDVLFLGCQYNPTTAVSQVQSGSLPAPVDWFRLFSMMVTIILVFSCTPRLIVALSQFACSIRGHTS
ncbi:hypothetical protein BDN67DRAFT_286414 [Paxillus ammoniavirescens]|nr:hypothetical protein BDN67DRAFT_286414 [Paxillus ammoniavirescens]